MASSPPPPPPGPPPPPTVSAHPVSSGKANDDLASRRLAEKGLVVERPGTDSDTSAHRVRVVFISDTHGKHSQYEIPPGDVLVHTGDFFSYLEFRGMEEFARDVAELDSFFANMPHKHKIFVAGNHEIAFYKVGAETVRSLLTNAHYLQDSACVVEGVKFYGSPWTTLRSMGFPSASAQERAARWDAIPDDTDVVLTHNPPLSILDLAWVGGANVRDCKVCGATRHWNKQHWGCGYLRNAVLQRVRPLVHAFGHVHDAHGAERHEGVLFVNSSMDLTPRPISVEVCVPTPMSPPQASSTSSRRPPSKKECCIS